MNENKYRTPTIDEFIQDFEYELLIEESGRYVMYDYNTNEECYSKPWKFEYWCPKIVTWKAPEGFTTVECDGITYTIDNSIGNFLDGISEEVLQKQINAGKIRVKINNYEKKYKQKRNLPFR